MSTATLIDGKAIAASITQGLEAAANRFRDATGTAPGLAVILVGDNPASAIYVRNKARLAKKLGLHSIQETLPADVPETQLIDIIDMLNAAPEIHGILVQMPLPAHIDANRIIERVLPQKDVDGFHPLNIGYLGSGQPERALLPCTPAGSVVLAKSALGDDLSGRHGVVVGRSNIVGKPAAQLLLAENCTTTVAHSRTRDLPDVVRSADIVIAAVGQPELIKGDWIKPGAIVIDVGINRLDAPELGEGKTRLVGDVDFAAASQHAGAITPVPGGVGPMTIAMLMKNTLTAACRLAGVEILK